MIDLERTAIEALRAYQERGGAHPAFAVFCDGETEWRVMLGNGICSAVALGEVEGEVCGDGASLGEAMDNLTAKLAKWKPR